MLDMLEHYFVLGVIICIFLINVNVYIASIIITGGRITAHEGTSRRSWCWRLDGIQQGELSILLICVR